MEHEARKYLWDARKAADAVARFAEGKTFDDYLADDLLRSAVERQFQIVGEAIAQLAKLDTRTAERVPGFREIVAFRNILVHGYALLDNRLVWRGGRGGRSETARRDRAAAGRGGGGLGTAASGAAGHILVRHSGDCLHLVIPAKAGIQGRSPGFRLSASLRPE